EGSMPNRAAPLAFSEVTALTRLALLPCLEDQPVVGPTDPFQPLADEEVRPAPGRQIDAVAAAVADAPLGESGRGNARRQRGTIPHRAWRSPVQPFAGGALIVEDQQPSVRLEDAVTLAQRGIHVLAQMKD